MSEEGKKVDWSELALNTVPQGWVMLVAVFPASNGMMTLVKTESGCETVKSAMKHFSKAIDKCGNF